MMLNQKPWVSFCISTYKRPQILHTQLVLLSQQSFPYFEVVVSDNDPEASARLVVEQMNDSRFRYFHNSENLGMIKSFNKSIQRANTEFIVMVTDDDPIDTNFLEVFFKIYQSNPGYSAYCGFLRNKKISGGMEIVTAENFIAEILDPDKTFNLLWSSAVIRREDALKINCIPDYGSPHLADHAFLALAGSIKGGILINKMYSTLTSHDSNFSKVNFNYYVDGCSGFYKTMIQLLPDDKSKTRNEQVVLKHIGRWFITNMFSLKKYYTIHKQDLSMLSQLKSTSHKILAFDFMRKFRFWFFLKNCIFILKRKFHLLK